MFIILIISILVSLLIGEVNFSLQEIINIFQNKSSIEYTILKNVRLPRILLAVSVGGSLSISGVILQGIYKNSLVEPYTLGISGGASLGVAIAIVFNMSNMIGIYALPISGFLGAIFTSFMVYVLSMKNSYSNMSKMLLIGVMISFMSSSILMLLMSISTTENLHSIMFWIMGSLGESDWTLVMNVFYASILGLIITYLFSNQLNAFRLGQAKAKHLGVNTAFTIKILFIISSILTGISVSIAGVIGFVGFVIPHVIRLIIGTDYRFLIPAAFLGGSVFLIISDTIARTIISPNELPVGVITGIIGGLLFIYMMSDKYKISRG